MRAFPTAQRRLLWSVGLGLALCACGGQSAYSQIPGGGPAGSSPTSSSSLKPILSGLISENGPPPTAYLHTVKNFVVAANWADLQPQSGGPIVTPNAIDHGIAVARANNLSIKVRLYGGIHAPDWAKNIDGPPVAIHDPVDNVSGTIGRFWTTDYGKAYQDLITKLAALYDAVPEVKEIIAARCTTVYSEPFIRDTGDPTTVRNLINAGFTTAADQTCQEQQITAHKVFVHTRTGVAFSEYQQINADGSTARNLSFSEAMVRYCRQILGWRCSIENNAIRASSTSPLYAFFKTQGAPIAFQTAGANRVGNVQRAIQLAVSYGATSVEVLTQLLPAALQAAPGGALPGASSG